MEPMGEGGFSEKGQWQGIGEFSIQAQTVNSFPRCKIPPIEIHPGDRESDPLLDPGEPHEPMHAGICPCAHCGCGTDGCDLPYQLEVCPEGLRQGEFFGVLVPGRSAKVNLCGGEELSGQWSNGIATEKVHLIAGGRRREEWCRYGKITQMVKLQDCQAWLRHFERYPAVLLVLNVLVPLRWILPPLVL